MATTQQLLQQARDFHRQGQMQTALELYRTAVKTNPRHADSQTALGMALAQAGLDAEAVGHLERAIKLEPTDPQVLCNLAMVHRSQGRLDEALQLYERAGWLSKRYARAIAGAAEIHAIRGEHGKAYALLLPYVQSSQDSPPVALTYARCCRFLGKSKEAAPALARHLGGASGELPPQSRVNMLLELANIAEQLGHPDRGFAAATDANKVLGRRFNAKAYVEASEKVISDWTPDVHAELPKSATETELPVLIVGMPRCGAALVEQIIASHPEAAPAGETALTRHLLQRFEGGITPTIQAFTQTETMTFQAVNEGANFYTTSLQMIARREGATTPKRITDRCTHNYLYLGLLDRLLPQGRVIHVRRNPLDTALSCYMTAFDIPYLFKTHLADFAVTHKAYERIMDHWKSVISMQVLEVDYEDIVSDVDTQARRIIEFLGLEWNDACLKFWETPRRMVAFQNQGILKPIYDTSAGRHKHYEPFIAPLRVALGMPPAEQPVAASDDDGTMIGDIPEVPASE
jgi:Flp pilus assembly protein TadD